MIYKNSVFSTILHGSEIPAHMLQIPVIEIAGEQRVLIENHFGVVRYSVFEICVKVKFGYVSVCGADLQLVQMTKEKIIITGTINCVRMRREEER